MFAHKEGEDCVVLNDVVRYFPSNGMCACMTFVCRFLLDNHESMSSSKYHMRIPATLVSFLHDLYVLVKSLPLFLANITKIFRESSPNDFYALIVNFYAHSCTESLQVFEHIIHKLSRVSCFLVA